MTKIKRFGMFNKSNKMLVINNIYNKIVVVQFFSLVISNLNGFVSNSLIGQFYGAESIAAVGLFSPLLTLICILNIFCVGANVKCCEYIGLDKRKESSSVFTSISVFLFLVGLGILFLIWIFINQIASILGATGSVSSLLISYIKGYSVGIPMMFLLNMLLAFLQVNNKIKMSYISIVVMFFANILFCLANIYVFKLGLFGIGLASGLSYIVSCCVIIPSFVGKSSNKIVYFDFQNISFRDFPNVFRLGLPEAMFTLGVTVKSYLINIELINIYGVNAVAVMNVENILLSFLGCFSLAIGNSILILGTYFRGQNNVVMYKKLLRHSIWVGISFSLLFIAIIVFFNEQITSLFISDDQEAFDMCVNMLFLFSPYLLFNTTYNILLKSFYCAQYTKIVNLIAFAENITIAVIAILLGRAIGINGFWLSVTVGEIIIILVLIVISFIYNKKISLKFENVFLINKKFNTNEDEFLNIFISSVDDLKNLTKEIDEFCEKNKTSIKTKQKMNLIIEEYLKLVIDRKNNTENKNLKLDVTIYKEKSKYRIFIIDTHEIFNPLKPNPEIVIKNEDKVSMKLLKGVTSSVMYSSDFGANVIKMTIEENRLKK